MAEKPQPVQVLYCGVCGIPAEYCEFGPEFEKCKPWLIQNAPDLYPDLLKGALAKDADKVSDQLQSTSISDAGSSKPKEEVKRLPGGKIKKKGPTEKEQIDVQGDIAYDIVEFITDTWPDVLETSIFFIEDGKKVPAV
ncbi:hypothetical protein DH2020_018620 [Rehmannia glutinosa]|uniref:DENR N-terminal domain-containing protein n=1 Tax=Rehmannia glutinosa TaxID=99300 RepID=A0ABR0WLI4_REHGL